MTHGTFFAQINLRHTFFFRITTRGGPMFKFKHYLLTIALLSAVPAYTSANENDELDAQEMLAHEKAETAFEKYDQDQASEHEANLDGKELLLKAAKAAKFKEESFLDGKELLLKAKKAVQFFEKKSPTNSQDLLDGKELLRLAEKKAKYEELSMLDGKELLIKAKKIANSLKDKSPADKNSNLDGKELLRLAEKKAKYEELSMLDGKELLLKAKNVAKALVQDSKLLDGKELLRLAEKQAKEEKQSLLDGKEILHEAQKIAKYEEEKLLDGKELLYKAKKAELTKDASASTTTINYKEENLDGKELLAKAEKAYAIEEEKAFLSEVDDLMKDQADEVNQVAEEDCVNCKEDKADRRISALEGSIKGLTKKINSFFSKDKKGEEKKKEDTNPYLAGLDKFMGSMTTMMTQMIDTQKQMAASISALATKMENSSQMNNSILQGIMIGSMISGNYNPQGATFNPFNPFSAHYSYEEMLMNKYIGGNNFFRANRPAVGFNFGTVNQSGMTPQS